MPVPSVKGVVLAPLVARINRLVDEGKLGHREIDWILRDDDLALLENEQAIEPTLWYPIACQDRLLRVIRDVYGTGDDRVLVDFARETAERLLDTPSYASLVDGAARLGDRAGVALVKISELVFSFSCWSYRGSSLADFEVEVTGAEDLPETSRHAAAGFIAHLGSRFLGRPIEITSERPTPDRIVYRGRAR